MEHFVCFTDGAYCEFGLMKVASAEQLNAMSAESRQNTVEYGETVIAEHRANLEASSMQRSQNPEMAAALISNQQNFEAVIRAMASEPARCQQVVCAGGGPSRYLGRCSARYVDVSPGS